MCNHSIAKNTTQNLSISSILTHTPFFISEILSPVFHPRNISRDTPYRLHTFNSNSTITQYSIFLYFNTSYTISLHTCPFLPILTHYYLILPNTHFTCTSSTCPVTLVQFSLKSIFKFLCNS